MMMCSYTDCIIGYSCVTCDNRYKQLKVDLSNQYAMRNDQYPVTLAEAFALLGSYIASPSMTQLEYTDSDSEDDTQKLNKALTFLNSVKPCPKCSKFHGKNKTCPLGGSAPLSKKEPEAHLSKNKPEILPPSAGAIVQTNLHVDTDEIEEGFQLNFSLNTVGATLPKVPASEIILANQGLIPKYWVLLDNQSTVHIFKNKQLLSDIKTVQPCEGIRCYCNGGYQDSTQKGTVHGVGSV